MISRICLLITVISMCVASGANAGPVFDDILNAMQIDQALSRSGDDLINLTPDKPLGQTFTTGDNVVQLCRIAVHVAYWHEEWQPDETLVLTLWDSPEKKTQLGQFKIPYVQRQWQDGILMFYVEAKVEPNKQYYFELNVEGGNGKIVGILLSKFDIPYPGGQGHEGGKPMERNLWFETHVKKTADRDANLMEFYDNFNLDFPGMEKVKAAVSAKDWDTAQTEFLAYMESKKDLLPDDLATPKLDPAFDTREADLVADQKWPAQDGTIVDLGPNWNYFATWPTLGGVGLTRTGLQKPLAFTYTKTGDEKYARAWNDMLTCMFRNVPSPLKSGVIKGEGRIRPTIPEGISGCLWDSISIAARLHHETFYNRFRKTPIFTPDVRMAWWANLVDMANLLERMDAGGNWTTQNDSSMFGLGQKYLELKKSKKWFAQGFEGLKANLMENTYPDGPLKEATTGYHGFSVGMFYGVITSAQKLGLDVPKEHLNRLEKTFEYCMYTTQPDWQAPVWGDTNRIMDYRGGLAGGADLFNRPDMLWVATSGKEGKKPSKASVEFPDAGYYIMRSGWDPQAKFLVTRNGYSQSHYHSDQLSVIVNAYGVDLLPDMGVYTYGTPEMNELVKTTSHNTISVDGKNILPGSGLNTWASLPGFDYFDGTSPGYHDLPDVKHERSIIFVKPDYWVVADRVTGSGSHTASQYWHFAPGKVDLDTTGTAITTNLKGNIAVIPLYPQGRKNILEKGLYAVSWFAAVNDAPVVKYEKTGALPMSFCTVLFPYSAGKPADLKVDALPVDGGLSQMDVMAARISHGTATDYVAFNKTSQAVSINGGRMQLKADAAVVRTLAKNGKVTGFSMQNGNILTIGKTLLAIASLSQVKTLNVSYAGDTMTLDADGAQNCSLAVATLGAKKAVVNGKTVKITKGAKVFFPFGK